MKLSHMDLPVKTAFDVRMMVKKLTPIYQCYADTEVDIIKKYGGEIQDDGRVVLGDREKENDLQSALSDLAKSECDEKIAPIHIKLDSMDGIRLSADDLEALESFVVFD